MKPVTMTLDPGISEPKKATPLNLFLVVQGLGFRIYWIAVKELKSSYCNKQTPLFDIYP